MQRLRNIFLKVALTVFCIVCVFGIPEYTSSSHGISFFAVHTAYAIAGGHSQGPSTSLSAPATNQSTASWTDWVNFIISGAFLIYLSGMLMYLAGYLLNGSIQIFVVEMGSSLSKGSSLGDAIITSWGIIRDIINLTFVFGMIYLAFMTIVRANTDRLKHGVIQIIIAALLINFSLFFGKVVIDLGNVAALEIYTYMESKAGNTSGDYLNYGISGFFVDKMGLSHFFDPKDLIGKGQDPALAFDNKSGFGFAILVAIVFLITSFVFFAGAVLIAIRFIVLALLLVLSPVAFAKAALPGINTEEWSRKWWSSLVSQVIFLPAYFLLLYISMTAVSGSKQESMVGFFKGEPGLNPVRAILNFVIIIGFLVGSLIISKRIGAYGASTVNAWGKSARMYSQRAIGNATVGLSARLGRGTIGRFGSSIANSDDVKDRASRKGAVGFVNRQLLKSSRLAETASFDARQVGGLGKNLGIGEGRTGGWKKSMEEVANSDKAFAESLGTVDEKDPRVVMMKQMQEDAEHHQHEEEEELKRLRRQLNEAKNGGTPAAIAAAEKALKDQETNVKEAKKAAEGAKENVDREKNRRQVGRAVLDSEKNELKLADATYNQAEYRLDLTKKALKRATAGASKATNSKDREKALADIAKRQKEVKDLERNIETMLTQKVRGGDAGYAGVLDLYSDESTKLNMLYGAAASALAGRTRSMSRASAKAVRDTKIKAKKEEKKAKKADHDGGDKGGKGGDDHGGGGGDNHGGGHGGH